MVLLIFEHVSGLNRTFHLTLEVIGKPMGLRVSGSKIMKNHTQASSNNLPEYDFTDFWTCIRSQPNLSLEAWGDRQAHWPACIRHQGNGKSYSGKFEQDSDRVMLVFFARTYVRMCQRMPLCKQTHANPFPGEFTTTAFRECLTQQYRWHTTLTRNTLTYALEIIINLTHNIWFGCHCNRQL